MRGINKANEVVDWAVSKHTRIDVLKTTTEEQ